MFCEKCGKEIMDEAVICPNCGCSTTKKNTITNTSSSQEYATLSNINNLTTPALILAFLVPLIGIVIAGIGLSKVSSAKMLQLSAKGSLELDNYKSKFTTSIIIASVILGLSFVSVIIVSIVAFAL
jgi:hypothetical protein